MKTFIRIVISVVIQIILFIIAQGLSHTFPSLGVIPYWVLGFISGMIVAIAYDEIDKDGTFD